MKLKCFDGDAKVATVEVDIIGTLAVYSQYHPGKLSLSNVHLLGRDQLASGTYHPA
jgi:hypothetical protein